MADERAEASWWRKLLFIPPLAIAAAVLFWVVSGAKPPERKPPEEAARHVRVIKIEEMALVPRVRGFGTVRPIAVFNVVAQVAGQIVYVHPDFKKGAVLPADTEIIRIDARDYELAIAEAEANIRAAESKMAEIAVNKQNLTDLLKIEKRSLQLQETQLKRTENLRKSGTLPQARVDDETRVTLSQRKLVRDLENSLRLLPTQEAVQAEQVSVNKAHLETAKLNLFRTSIRLPFPARIADVDVEVTQFVQAGSKLGTADDIRISEIEAQFPIGRLASIGQGMTVDGRANEPFTRQALAEMAKQIGLHSIVRLGAGELLVEWRGEIVRASDVIDQSTRTVGIISIVRDSYKQAVPGRRPPLTKGMFVEVELRRDAVPGQLLIPRAALHEGRLFVVNAENRLEIRSVKTGAVQDDIISVTDGLTAGETIVVSDLAPAIEGMLLKPDVDAAVADWLATVARSGEAAR